MKQLFLSLILLTCTASLFGQGKEITLNIGDSLTLGPCTGTHNKFAHIDLMKKTRFPNPDATYDTATGAGFYNWYFNGDIDSQRLGCKNTGLKFRIASIHQHKEKDGSVRTIVFGQIFDETMVLWIKISPAIHAGEVIP